MDELNNTPETNNSSQTPQLKVSLDELLKWADEAIDSFDHPKATTPAGEAAEAIPPEAAAEEAITEDIAAAENKADIPQDPSPQDDEDDGDLDQEDYDTDEFDYNDDELLKDYIWDEETGRLYRVKEKKKRPLSIPLFLAALGIIAVLSAVINKSPLLPAQRQQDNSILSEEQQDPQQPVFLPQDQQQAAEEETICYIPAEIISDGEVVGIMASTEAAHALLEDVKAYFHDSVTGEGEKVSDFEDPVELRPLPNGTSEAISSYDELFALYTSSKSPIKVRTTLTTVKTEIIPFDTETERDSTLIEGTRIIASMGREGSETERTYTVYINGDRSSSRSGSDTETIKPMDMLILEGKEDIDPDEDSPGRHEGEKGPDQGDLTFIAPIDGDISCNFGQLYGVLHLGLDYETEDSDQVLASEAGTVVTLMERGGYGLVLEIDHGNGFVTRYAHLDSASVALGDKVEQGQPIAMAGSSGNVEEKSLHFEIRADGIAYNPRYYLD